MKAFVGKGERNENKFYLLQNQYQRHRSKVCDQISDAILDACLAQDPNSRVPVRFHNLNLVVGGEVTTTAQVDYEKDSQDVLRQIGYIHNDLN